MTQRREMFVRPMACWLVPFGMTFLTLWSSVPHHLCYSVHPLLKHGPMVPCVETITRLLPLGESVAELPKEEETCPSSIAVLVEAPSVDGELDLCFDSPMEMTDSELVATCHVQRARQDTAVPIDLVIAHHVLLR